MLTVTVFGTICELDDDDPFAQRSSDIPGPTPRAGEGSGHVAVPEPDPVQIRRGRWAGPVEHAVWPGRMPRWQRRWYSYQHRRRKHVGLRFTDFADLSDGRRVIIRNDRGFGWSWRHLPGPLYGRTRENLVDEVRRYLAAEEEDCCPVSPQSVVEHIRHFYDTAVDLGSVQTALQLPRQIEFGTRLLRQLPPDEPSTGSSGDVSSHTTLRRRRLTGRPPAGGWRRRSE